MTLRHAERTALVTGAGSGIGKETSRLLASQGARVVVTDIDAGLAEGTAQEIRDAGGEAVAAQVDVREREQVRAAVQLAVSTWGGLHLLVNNAGLVTRHSLADLTEEAWDLVMDVNTKGQWLVAQEAAEEMAASGGGAIVGLSSVEGIVIVTSTGTAQPHYNASKGAIPLLTKALAVELAPKNIRVNCVAPGPIATDFFDYAAVTSPEGMEFMKQRLLIHRVGQPRDIANAISWLLSDEASFITGIQLPVDGGWLTR
ncbi:MAG TPA: SDR family NAD(P)-dependent oxidoreductase [Ornithinicoccus sp.]|jgi:glucose 1-dehydrogenase/3-oxoacyl-[acyl-carrier protein] reductase|nr:SDR family NAD(P)-dependent oxidoreductase [Ornithinicoccus sp.]